MITPPLLHPRGVLPAPPYVNADFDVRTITVSGTGQQVVTGGVDLSRPTDGDGKGFSWIKRLDGTGNHFLTPNYTTNNLANTTNPGALVTNSSGEKVAHVVSQYSGANGGTIFLNNPNNGLASGEYVVYTIRESRNTNWFSTYHYQGLTAQFTMNPMTNAPPGMILVKHFDPNGVGVFWRVWHKDFDNTATDSLVLNNDAAISSGSYWDNFSPTSTAWRVGGDLRLNFNQYHAFIFGHDTSSTGRVACGRYTGNGTSVGPMQFTGWPPSWVLIKRIDASGRWLLYDRARGLNPDGADPELNPNLDGAQINVRNLQAFSDGWRPATNNSDVNAAGGQYVWFALRLSDSYL